MKKFQEHLDLMESAIASAGKGERQLNLQNALTHLKNAITSVCEITENPPPKLLSELIQNATENTVGRRASAILIVRVLAVDDLLPFSSDSSLNPKIVRLIEEGLPEQCKNLNLKDKKQTFEKINSLKGLHESLCSILGVLKKLPRTLAEIDYIQNDISKALHHKLLNAYLEPYGWIELKSKIGNTCVQIKELASCKDSTYKTRLDQLTATCRELMDVAFPSHSFLNREYVVPFVKAVEYALQSIQSGAAHQFACTIETRRKPPHVAEKRYPLHQEGKMLTITFPLINHGPGIAVDVTVELDCGNNNSLLLDSQETHLGDIPPGEFAVAFKAMLVKPVNRVDMAMQVNWNQLFGTPQSITFDVQLTAQNAEVDWNSLEQQEPYSLEVAEDDKFVGRKAKVQAIGNRLLKAQMSSTYITGQKRIGKTSLANAVLRYVATHAKSPTIYATFYLEWGEYCAADATKTLKALGDQIYGFLRSHLTQGFVDQTPTFEGSLAPLNVIAKLLETTSPEKRFVIVLDEFDEIHPEMYRYGPLAEAFFANLRTLSARKNLAFILVGGEKMPFIIGAQGDQLNKFVREPLDYFSRSDEWNDYVELVTSPVTNSLNWEDSALNELFSITNGHPYYTKLICAKIFSTAVAQRDTEIITSDVKHALNGHVSELDTNAFAHFWKDGINAERMEAEVIELKRQRVLVAFGRSLRTSIPNKSLILQQANSALQPSDIVPLIEDFCRRDIMKEVDGSITMQLPIFQRWIQDIGVSKIITSTLADDMENELQMANDNAYVKAIEIENLAEKWPLYRGHKITGEAIRAWLDQVPNIQKQRMLFTILTKLKFITQPIIAEFLRDTHKRIVAPAISPRIRANKTDKRRDILITYLDGAGKSGATYAKSYAKENDILMECVVEKGKVARRLAPDSVLPKAVIVVDDLSGTGNTIAASLQSLHDEIGNSLSTHNIPLFVVILFATEDAETKIKSALNNFSSITSTLHICEILGDENRAFNANEVGFWNDENLRDRAKAMCIDLGTGLYKDALGFGSQSLLIAFPETCPNNCLPIIFASRQGKKPWKALIPRPVS